MFQSAALAGALLLPFAFLLYVTYRGRFPSQVTNHPWAYRWARDEEFGWVLGVFIGLLLCVLTVAWYSAGVG